MFKVRLLKAALCTLAVLSTNVYALQFGAPMTASVMVTKPGSPLQKKTVTVMNIVLTSREKQMAFSYKPKNDNAALLSSSSTHLPASVTLGMNHVPVLDQGLHGTCVTFAATAAIDAVLNKRDYVSQLCHLTLGAYLEKNGYMPSGWNGTFGPYALDQMLRFGVVNKSSQAKKTCGGLKDYPGQSFTEEGKPMPLDEYKQISEDISSKLYVIQHMSSMQRFESKFADTNAAEKALTVVKTGIMHGHRFVIGVLLKMSPYCSAAACANRNEAHDTWALTKELELPVTEVGGHEMVVTGYDDNAIAYDQYGKKHQGLLSLRNSWGNEVGDRGDYYMSYDYFRAFVMEVQEIVEVPAVS